MFPLILIQKNIIMKNKKLKCVANGVLGQFLARTNDIDGYWALGKVFKSLSDLELKKIRIDIFKLNSVPHIPETHELVRKLKSCMTELVEKNHLEIKCISFAQLSINFLVFESSHSKNFISEAKEGPFIASLLIEDGKKNHIQ